MSKIILHATREAWDTMWAAIHAVDTEIGGWGYVERQDDGTLLWHKTFLVPQTVSGSGVDFTDDTYGIMKAKEDGVLGDENFVWLWWHSHAFHGVYWSSTDEKDFIEKMRLAGAPYMVSVVGNHDNKYTARVDIFDHPLAEHITFEKDDVEVRVLRPVEIEASVQSQITQLVTKRKPAPKPQQATGNRQTAVAWGGVNWPDLWDDPFDDPFDDDETSPQRTCEPFEEWPPDVLHEFVADPGLMSLTRADGNDYLVYLRDSLPPEVRAWVDSPVEPATQPQLEAGASS